MLTADVLQAGVTGSCNGGVPGFADSGGVTNVDINGNQVPTDEPYQQTGNGLNGSPLGQVTKVFFNETTADRQTRRPWTQSVTRRAIHVQIFDGNGNVVFEAVSARRRPAATARSASRARAARRARSTTRARSVCVIASRTASNGPARPTRQGG